MAKRRFAFFLIIVLAAISLPVNAGHAPKNVILMIGDGMGLGQVTLARLTSPTSSLNMDTMRYTAFVKTQSADCTITDSAAAGTALATGYKTNNGMIGVLPDETIVQSILEAASKIGKATGLVTNTTITHATPASFGAHVIKRSKEKEIGRQYMQKNVDVLLGGGKDAFIPDSNDKNQVNVVMSRLQTAGYTLIESRDSLLSSKSEKLLGVFEKGALTTESPDPSLAEMACKAIELLSRDKDGFFLMVEGGQIDFKCHDHNSDGCIKQTLDFDAAIGKALEFARKRGDTLVVVTADHETGGLVITYPDAENPRFKINWGSNGHSGSNVPLFADGPGADTFTGVMDNTDVPKKIASLWKIKGFAVTPLPTAVN